MNYRWGAVLAFAAIVLSPVAAGAEEPKGAPPHIAAVRAFLVAWVTGDGTTCVTSPPTRSP